MSDNRQVVPTEDCELTVGTTYVGETSGIGHEPINRLLGCGNMGGFRARGSILDDAVKLVALVTTLADPEWPDHLERATGRFTYFGDNKTPGCDLHATSKHGNQLLRATFSAIHVEDQRRDSVPPFFVFHKHGANRGAKFLGVAAPGAEDCAESEDLVAAWTTRGNERFQNYRAVFTVLDVPVVSRAWIREIHEGLRSGPAAPEAWTHWVVTGGYRSIGRTE